MPTARDLRAALAACAVLALLAAAVLTPLSGDELRPQHIEEHLW